MWTTCKTGSSSVKNGGSDRLDDKKEFSLRVSKTIEGDPVTAAFSAQLSRCPYLGMKFRIKFQERQRRFLARQEILGNLPASP
jgi:hypothetical protein